MIKIEQEKIEEVYAYLDKMGFNYTIDKNPTPEKIARIKAQIEKNKERFIINK
jgi:hypothetical protein